ncbi:MAG: phage repressor protein/antirepressor Ant [Clostridiaceae bacterium]|nr:phage repressor protein/antirepressor Ant [Clostridiaceae bacterium]
MNQLTVFKYSDKPVRTFLKNGEPWFVAADVCNILGLNTSEAVHGKGRSDNEGLDDDEKGIDIVDTPGGKQRVTIVSEAGLYTLVLKSRKPEAKPFKRWITHEVIPSIRKHGAYMTPDTIEKVLSDPDTIIRLATELKQERQRRLELEPKAEAYDTFMNGSNLQTMNDVAKCLGIGRNKLFAFLRDKKILRANNTPYQEYIDRGYFEVKEKPIKMGDVIANMLQTFVTAKGVDYINKILNQSLVKV